MFKIIEGLPQDVLAIEASGKVTYDDYRNTLMPKAEAMIARGPIKMLHVIGKDFAGLSLARCGRRCIRAQTLARFQPHRRGN